MFTSPNKARSRVAGRARVESFEPRLLLSGVDVTSYHGSTLTSQGVNDQETQLTPGNVNVATFGKEYTTNIDDTPYTAGIPASVLNPSINYNAPDGQAYAEPLVKTGVDITTGNYQGIHDVVYVATVMDSVFAIDADGGTVLWKDSFVYNPAGNPNPLNPTVPLGVTPIPGGYGTETNSQDITPWMGIIGTPVIDPTHNCMYLIANTRIVINGDQTDPHYVFTIHKIDLGSGLDTSSVFADTTLGNAKPTNPTYTYNSPTPWVYGTASGAIKVNGKSVIYFNAVRAMNRPALELYNGRLYAGFASHSDNQPYEGWIMTFDATTLAINAAFNTCPNSSQGEGGIWNGGDGITFDSNGNFYTMTGNGAFDGNFTTDANGVVTYTGLDANGFPIEGDYGDCILKLSLDPTSTEGNQGTNKNGFGITVDDYFSPHNNQALDDADIDLGSGGVSLLPAAAGSAAHPDLLVAAGKEGTIYLIDRDNMGKFAATDNVVEELGDALSASLDTPAYFNGRLYYFPSYGGNGVSWQLTNAQIVVSTAQKTSDGWSFPGSSPYISANGTTNGIVWTVDKASGSLRAYAADNLNDELWASYKDPTRDALGTSVKFSVATPVNGRVYVGTADNLVVYGPPLAPTAPPPAPTNLLATVTGASTIALTWTDNSNNEDEFLIERSNNGTAFTQIGFVGVNATKYTDTQLSPEATYYYRVRAYNSFDAGSYSAYTNVVGATTISVGMQTPVDLYHFDEGTGNLTADSVGTNNGTLVGTTLPTWVSPGRVGPSAISFSGDGKYLQSNESAVQTTNDLSTILGGTSTLAVWIKTTQVGNDLHYQAPAITGVDQLGGTNDINWGYIDGEGRIGLHVGDTGGILSTAPINDGQWHHVAITRDAVTGNVSLYIDGVLNASSTLETGLKTTPFKLIGALSTTDITGQTLVGANYFNGQLDDLQIYNTALSAANIQALAQPPAAPTNLAVTAASGTELDLTWVDHSTTETGYEIDRSMNGGPYVTLPELPPLTTMFDDVALTQDATYTYRVYAVNTAGSSAYSNLVTAATPVPPAHPSNATATLVAATEIDLQWQLNSADETGIRIFRSPLAGEFVQVANLPAGTTTYQDVSGLAPGTEYDYHIQAYNIAGVSDFTGGTWITLANTPANVTAVTGSTGVTVTWTASAGAVTYNLYRSTTSGGEGTKPLITGITAATYLDKSAANGVTYYYEITAVNSATAESPASAEVQSTAAPATPLVLTGAAFYLQRDIDGLHLDVWNNTLATGIPTQSLLLSMVSSVSIAATATTATFTVDFTNGNPLPATGLTVAGAGGKDALKIVGTTGNDSVSVSGSLIGVAAAFGSASISYAGLGSISFAGGTGADTLTQTAQPGGGAALVYSGMTTTDTLAVNAGVYTFPAQPAGSGIVPMVLGSLSIGASSEAVIAAPDVPADRAVLELNLLTIAGTAGGWLGTLDLGGNDLIIHNGNLATAMTQILSGYNAAAWTGTGITSSTAAADKTKLTGLGVILNDDGTGHPIYSTATSLGLFDGIAAASTDLLIKYTYVADANLDGQVDGSDYTKIDNGFNSGLSSWENGDFNYNGIVDGSDYSLIDNVFSTLNPIQPATKVATAVAVVAAIPSTNVLPGTFQSRQPIADSTWLASQRDKDLFDSQM